MRVNVPKRFPHPLRVEQAVPVRPDNISTTLSTDPKKPVNRTNDVRVTLKRDAGRELSRGVTQGLTLELGEPGQLDHLATSLL